MIFNVLSASPNTLLFLLFLFLFSLSVSCCVMFLLAQASDPVGATLEIIVLSGESIPVQIDPSDGNGC